MIKSVLLSLVSKGPSIVSSIIFSLLAVKYSDSEGVLALVLLLSLSTLMATIYRMGIDDVLLVDLGVNGEQKIVEVIAPFFSIVLLNFLISYVFFIAIYLVLDDLMYLAIPILSLSLCLNFIYCSILVAFRFGDLALALRGTVSYLLCIPFLFISFLFSYDMVILCSVFSLGVNFLIYTAIASRMSLGTKLHPKMRFKELRFAYKENVNVKLLLYAFTTNLWMNIFVILGWVSGGEKIAEYNLVQRVMNVSSTVSQIVLFKYSYLIGLFTDKVVYYFCLFFLIGGGVGVYLCNGLVLTGALFVFTVLINGMVLMSKYSYLRNKEYNKLAFANTLMSLAFLFFSSMLSGRVDELLILFSCLVSFVWFFIMRISMSKEGLC